MKNSIQSSEKLTMNFAIAFLRFGRKSDTSHFTFYRISSIKNIQGLNKNSISQASPRKKEFSIWDEFTKIEFLLCSKNPIQKKIKTNF